MSYETFAEFPAMPVHVGVLWEDAASAKSSVRGDVALAFCPTCGFIGNRAFDADRVDYELRYDNALHFSPTFRKYEEDTARRLIDGYGIRERRIAEIGCGSGHFLSLICELGRNRGIGFDPSYRPGDEPLPEGVRILPEYYSEDHAEHSTDLLCCRHVLEHIPEPRGFLDMVRRALASDPGAVIYFEVPNAFLVLRELSIWDVIYEHCNYFAGVTLEALFRRSGFEVLEVREPYRGQFLSLEARLARDPEETSGARVRVERDALAVLGRHVEAFADHVREKRQEWNERLASLSRAGSSAVIWGGGAKTVSFLNLVDAHDTIRSVVDINPGKQGSFIAGTGQPIVSPERLAEIAPDVVVVMNPVYRAEIEAQLTSLGLAPEVIAV
jgi:SAM-dependent methyltransferase